MKLRPQANLQSVLPDCRFNSAFCWPSGSSRRQRTHLAAAAARRRRSTTCSGQVLMAGAPAPPAEAWQLEFTASLPALEALLSAPRPAWPLRVLRSSQLDAGRLDAELHTMLHEQFMAVFQLFQPGRVSALEPELDLLLALLVYLLSIWRGHATPGSDLMNLRYRNERAMAAAAAAGAAAAAAAGGATAAAGVAATAAAAAAAEACGQQQPAQAALRQVHQPPPWLHGGRTGIEGPGLSRGQKLGYGLGLVAAPYAWARLSRHAAAAGWGQDPGDARGTRAWALLRGVDAAHKLAVLLNLWVFLYEGKYRTLVERLLGARLVYKQPNMSRLISFEYLNRQLVWQELSELLLFLLPLINVAKVRRAVMRLLPRLPQDLSGGGSSSMAAARQAYPVADKAAAPGAAGAAAAAGQDGAGGAGAGSSASSGAAAAAAERPMKPVGPCGICGASEILVPFVAQPCRHVFCYYCLRGHCEADAGFRCPLDDTRVEGLQRYARAVPRAGA